MASDAEEESVGLGLDLTNADVTTAAEKERYRASFVRMTGHNHEGLNFWLEHRPDVLKRYRAWADRIDLKDTDPNISAENRVAWSSAQYSPHRFALILWYAVHGFPPGVRYLVQIEQRNGLTRSMVLEGIAVTFIWGGPHAMNTIADALTDYEWTEPTDVPHFPSGWGPDDAAFKSGLDFSTPRLSEDERSSIVNWYSRVEGEVPAYVTFMGKHRPDMLKAYRNRFENALDELPKQVMPYIMIGVNVQRGFQEGIREGVNLARGFGVTKSQALEAVSWGTFFGGMEAASIAAMAADDLFDAWD